MTNSSKNLNHAFGSVIAQARRAAGWTQEELAHRAGVHRTYIGDIENGRKSPTLDVVQALATALGKSTHELIRAAEEALISDSDDLSSRETNP